MKPLLDDQLTEREAGWSCSFSRYGWGSIIGRQSGGAGECRHRVEFIGTRIMGDRSSEQRVERGPPMVRRAAKRRRQSQPGTLVSRNTVVAQPSVTSRQRRRAILRKRSPPQSIRSSEAV
jgi:hypothetical protein